ncbi:MAG: gliding motility protein GldC [Bacteroidetes bacterium]|nr:gliding motility protein GldC [Bacteroidota bacterium]
MAKKTTHTTSEINFKVTLDEENIPEEIIWNATDSEFNEFKKCDSMNISIWDTNEHNTLSIALWTKKMVVEDMQLHFFQTLMTLAENFQKSTGNKKILEEMQKFCDKIADNLDPPPGK